VVFAILRALAASARRDLSTYAALRTNNFFLFVALLIWGALVAGVKPVSAEPFLLLLGVLLLFPISSDPLDRIPPIRLALWPIDFRRRLALRLASLALSPVLWLTLLLLILRASLILALSFAAFAVVIQALSLLFRRISWNVEGGLAVPCFPGQLGRLVSANLRQMLTLLDPYLALILSLGGAIWRIADPQLASAALPILSLLVAIALSTYTQCLFGLDSASAMSRYRLLPLRGWQILLAKDLAFLGLLLFLVSPLSPAAGLTFGLPALAIGRYPALRIPLPQRRWRFTSGRVLYGVLQGVVGCMLGSNAEDYGGTPAAIALSLYLISLYWGGRAWDGQLKRPVAARPLAKAA